MNNPVADALQHHADALRELARALVGSDDAEDVVQATAMAALRHPHPVRQPIAFLRHLLRVQAARHHRGTGRRRRREERHAAGVETAAPPADHAIEQRETITNLHAALMAVPQPHLGALLLRYFEDLSPPAIAEHLGVPLPTIKSRLQRGLELLRERLADGDRDDSWRPRLRRAFALPPPAMLHTGAALLLGVATMKALSAGVLAAALLTATWWLLVETTPTAPPPTAAAASATAGPVRAEAIPDARAARREAADTLATAADATPRVRGRIVVANDAPLVGATVDITTEQAPERTIATAVTTADGSFECVIAASGPHRLRIRAERHVTARTDARELAGSGVTDFGTIGIVPGVLVHGRVLDRDDRPVAATRVRLRISSRPGPAGTWWLWDPVTTDPDGRFTLGPLPPIEAPLYLADEQLLEPRVLQLTGASPDVDIVVRVEAASRHLVMHGRVVDERGLPIGGVRLTADEPSANGSERFEGTSAADGTFRVRRLQTTEARPVQLTARLAGRDRTQLDAVRWDQADLEVVLRPLLLGTVRVVTVRGRAVPNFTLRIGRVSVAGGMTTHDGEFTLLTATAAANGECAVPGLRRGLHDVHVAPEDAALAASGVQRWDVHDAACQLTVVVPDRCDRAVRLQDSNGTPVAGARVELCRPAFGPIELRSFAPEIARWTNFSVPEKSLLLQSEVSGPDGSVRLCGPAATALVLRVHGLGCVPFVLPLERLDGSGPLLVTAHRGGSLRMRARPADVLAQLAALPASSGEPSPPRLALDRRLQGSLERVPPEADGGVPFDAEGVATLHGVSPGVWTPRVQFADECLLLPDVTIGDERTIDVPLDLTELRTVTIRGRVTLDAATAGFRHVELERLRRRDERHAGRWIGVGNRGIALDADGAFVVQTVPGNFRLLLDARAQDRDRSNPLARPHAVEVAAGTTADVAFAVTLGTAAVRFVDEHQQPIAGVDGAWLRRNDGCFLAYLPASDAAGRAALDAIETGNVRLVVLPRRFGPASTAVPKLVNDHPDDETILDRTLLDLGPLTVRAGEPLESTFVLPAAWSR